MKLFTLLFLVSTISLHSFAQTETDKNRPYYCKEIGWGIDVPDGWTILSKERQTELNNIGKDAMEKTVDGEIDVKGLKNLISFQKDRFNVFMATIEPFKEDYPGEYENNNKRIDSVVSKTFSDAGIKVDTFSGKEVIANLSFTTFNTIVYSKQGDIILRQIMYSRLINGFDFGVTVSYNNERDKKVMINTLKNSKFQ